MIDTVKGKKYRPVDDHETTLVKTTRKNRKKIARVVAESTFFGLGYRYKYAQMAGITPAKHVEVPDSKPAMEMIERVLEVENATEQDLKKLQKELKSATQTRNEPIYELEDKWDEDGLYEQLMKVLFAEVPQKYDPENIDEGVVMEAFSDFWSLRAGTR